jgi:hypothetical protein
MRTKRQVDAERVNGCGARSEPILHDRAAQAAMNPNAAVQSVFDEAFSPEAVHEKTHTRASRADHLGKERLADRDRERLILASGTRKPQQRIGQALLCGMGEVADQPFLVVGTTLRQEGREHLGKLRDFPQHPVECGGGYANDAGVNERGCGGRARPFEHATGTKELAGTAKRNDGFAAVAHDRRFLDAAAFDEKHGVGRITLRINNLSGRKLLPYLAVTFPCKHYLRIESVFSSSRSRQAFNSNV